MLRIRFKPFLIQDIDGDPCWLNLEGFNTGAERNLREFLAVPKDVPAVSFRVGYRLFLHYLGELWESGSDGGKLVALAANRGVAEVLWRDLGVRIVPSPDEIEVL